MVRALDNIETIPTGNLIQRKRELMSEVALLSKKNKTGIRSVMKDYAAILWELNKR